MTNTPPPTARHEDQLKDARRHLAAAKAITITLTTVIADDALTLPIADDAERASRAAALTREAEPLILQAQRLLARATRIATGDEALA